MFWRFGVLLSLALMAIACKKPLENPELIDPIYKDLGTELSSAKGSLAAEEKSVKELQDKIKALPPRDIGRIGMQKELIATEKKVVQLRQNVIYFEVRREQRLKFVQESYMRAFEADKPWPDPNEYAEYKKIKQLRAAPRQWDARVPKLTRHLKKAPTAQAPASDNKPQTPPAH